MKSLARWHVYRIIDVSQDGGKRRHCLVTNREDVARRVVRILEQHYDTMNRHRPHIETFTHLWRTQNDKVYMQRSAVHVDVMTYFTTTLDATVDAAKTDDDVLRAIGETPTEPIKFGTYLRCFLPCMPPNGLPLPDSRLSLKMSDHL